MSTTLLAWAVMFFALAVLAVFLGLKVCAAKTPLGILIDNRGRYSLTHLQLVLWTTILVSLIAGVFIGRLISNIGDALDFSIPAQVLGLLGISAGSAVSATTIKASKDATRAEYISASVRSDGGGSNVTRPRLAQIFLAEEGTFADKVIDITKFQNLCFTFVLVAAYTAQAIGAIDAGPVSALPTLSPTFLTLLGISHAAYVAGKIPTQQGSPEGLTVADLQQRRSRNPTVEDSTP